MKKILKTISLTALAVSLTVNPVHASSKGWVSTKAGWQYKDETGNYVKNKWIGSYYIKKNGTMAEKEWVKDGSNWYYLEKDGTYARNKWIGSYYLKKYGDMAKSEWIKDDSNWYYLKPNGAYARNEWQGEYYLKQYGNMAKNEWIFDKTYNSWYFLKSDGAYARNEWQGEYYLKSNGKMAKSEKINGFEFGKDGKKIVESNNTSQDELKNLTGKRLYEGYTKSGEKYLCVWNDCWVVTEEVRKISRIEKQIIDKEIELRYLNDYKTIGWQDIIGATHPGYESSAENSLSRDMYEKMFDQKYGYNVKVYNYEGYSAEDFFKWAGSKEAANHLRNGYNHQYTHIGDKDDATSLANFHISLMRMKNYNDFRKAVGLNSQKTSDFMMAYSMGNVNESKITNNHSYDLYFDEILVYSSFQNNPENGINYDLDFLTGAIFGERATLIEKINNLEFHNLTDEKLLNYFLPREQELRAKLDSTKEEVGHYIAHTKPNDVFGMATSNGTQIITYNRILGFEKKYRNVPDTKYTIEEYLKRFNEFLKTLPESKKQLVYTNHKRSAYGEELRQFGKPNYEVLEKIKQEEKELAQLKAELAQLKAEYEKLK